MEVEQLVPTGDASAADRDLAYLAMVLPPPFFLLGKKTTGITKLKQNLYSGPALWCGWLSCCLQHQCPIGASIQVLAPPISIQLLAVLEKAAKGGPGTWTPATCVGDQMKFQAPGFSSGSVAAIWKVNRWMEVSLSVSVTLPFFKQINELLKKNVNLFCFDTCFHVTHYYVGRPVEQTRISHLSLCLDEWL